ncbi:hypothetical protein DSO57_1029858 [Entomophthora muscae]|uniref:Uncharacterized protein n=1 Tax=Entomophthora muscae TaxID=34485 RepID=A0ACC2RS01_9FUNG|nr:hypothetical protein DSO57_1029858 [Entomophthora muscae]
MTPPLTPQPNCPMETPTAAKTTSTQLFCVLYITLTGMHPSYGGHYPLAQLYSNPSQPMPLPIPGFLTHLKQDHLSLDKDVQEMSELIDSVNYRFSPCLLVGPSLTSCLAELSTVVITYGYQLDVTE